MRKTISALLLICILFSISACANQSGLVEETQKSNDLHADDRTELVAVTDGALPELKKIVSRFNSESEDYYVKLIEYSGTERTMDLLRTEVIAGNGPDIYAFYSDGSLSEVSPESILEDMLPYLDIDSEYSRETLVPGLLNALSSGNRLYWLPYDFSVQTFMARPSMVGSKDRFTMEELDAIAAAQSPEISVFEKWMSREALLFHISVFSIDRFVDWQTGACDFMNPDFFRLLEKCNLQSEETDPGNNDKSVLSQYTLQAIEQISILETKYGVDFEFVGFPNEETNGSMFSMNLRLGVSNQCNNKEGAWSFVRSILSFENQSEATFLPSVKAELDKRTSQAVNGDYSAAYFGMEIAIEEASADKLTRLINGTMLLSARHAVLQQIIQEECSAYFAGGKSVEETAQIIQSRISLYILERI